MAAELRHVALANRNHRALKVLLPRAAEVPEWIATVGFYKAVQIAEAVFSHQPFCRNSSGHRDRLDTLKDVRPAGGELFKQYDPLMSASMLARYLRDEHTGRDVSSFEQFIPPEKVVRRSVKGRLRTFEQHAVGLLSAEGKRTLITLDKDPEIDLNSPTGLSPDLGLRD